MPADKLIIALPSKGKLGDDSDNFLARAGLPVYKPNRRQYSASIPSLPGVEVVYQRPRDILSKVSEGRADIGITGLDIVAEHSQDSADVMVIDELGYGRCALLLAVPDSWIDVSSMADLADLSLRQQESGAQLRIATKYSNLTKSFLYRQGISHFLLVHAEGALEAAPRMGYADLIADISETGTTLRENHLRPIVGGGIIDAQAVLIGNRRALRASADKLETLRELIERIEAHRRARQFVSLRANIAGESIADVQGRILANPALCGSKGPGVVAVASPPGTSQSWFETNLLVRSDLIHKTMQHLRALGGTDIIVTRPDYVFDAQSATYNRFEHLLQADERLSIL
ncbi:MAG: ATP phosphoribosyltransferase [Chloroflexi bacterium]|nr:ATP phosphoribosyltransferase [Chloroflexota bacterium]MCY3581097.1 ATP phosphoribosyltransferase [Chloroflexota bacterium]MCY3715626.1 ATP phosphoribosyltransferase [Chloroflexota bacterium]MDE2650636.1 ATP phosphoribosyltransferase [Chloroflexota bacterium]MXV92660.1 ATP phosphoribosyltransferase [Chloroflexota bacterium]